MPSIEISVPSNILVSLPQY